MEAFEWYAIRATGTVAYLLLYLSVLTGLYSVIQKRRKKKVNNLHHVHEVLSDWALILTAGHLGILMIDSYMPFKWAELFIPFDTSYETIPMAFGIVSTYFLIITIVTSKLRKKIGYKTWQKLHALNPILYIGVTLHTVMMGTDFHGAMLTAVAVANILPILFMIGARSSDKKPAAA
ncbi:ferric reductase-like transmembrane domain-containing protein [Ectobacillus ponti]|uniref:Ferric reductase-like transmembrane domain-containing protein n=1 Tax=Ectobacillus ponti TaxID=2961894 RepID=A0AA41XC79_9BACI|nr:ferric reductase-like transmembrane domain-containing protein [Ectobacillus ponti]MCP8970669.1 ferric reductase-like transmembrane domain-containing protein [Ectobacillus ponti]